MNGNSYLIDESKLTLQQKKMAKDNNVYMWGILNHMICRPNEPMAKEWHSKIVEDKHLQYTDAETNMNMGYDKTAKKIAFLYQAMQKDPKVVEEFKKSSLCKLSLLFFGAQKDKPLWHSWAIKRNVEKRYQGKNYMQGAFIAYRHDDEAKIELNTSKIIDLYVHETGDGKYYLKDIYNDLSEKERGEILEAITDTVRDLQKTKEFTENYYETENDSMKNQFPAYNNDEIFDEKE